MKLEYKIFTAGFNSIEDIINEIKALPTYQLQGKESYFVNVKEVGQILAKHVDVQLNKYGKWKLSKNGEVYCSECGAVIALLATERESFIDEELNDYKFCYNCGAYMWKEINYCEQCQHWKNSNMPCQWDYMYNNKDYYYDCTDFIRKEDNND